MLSNPVKAPNFDKYFLLLFWEKNTKTTEKAWSWWDLRLQSKHEVLWVRSLAPLTHSIAPHCSRSRSLTHSEGHVKVVYELIRFHAVSTHCDATLWVIHVLPYLPMFSTFKDHKQSFLSCEWVNMLPLSLPASVTASASRFCLPLLPAAPPAASGFCYAPQQVDITLKMKISPKSIMYPSSFNSIMHLPF